MTRGVARNLFRRGQKSGFRHQRDTEPRVGSGAKPQKPENYAQNVIECQKFHTIHRKNFQRGNFGGGHVPLVPLSYAPVNGIGICTQTYIHTELTDHTQLLSPR